MATFIKSRILIDLLLIIITAIASSVASSLFWHYQQRSLDRAKLHDTRISYLARVERDLSDFQSASYLWFFDDLALAAGQTVNGAESRHIAFHSAENELKNCVTVLPFFFGERVRKAVDELNQYFNDYQWEGIVQSPGFTSRAVPLFTQNGEQGETVTSLIEKKTNLDAYGKLRRELIMAMAQEISAEIQ
jgi:hypothetical protein